MRAVFLIVFLVLLVLPGANTLFPFIYDPPLTENRRPAPLPDLASIMKGDGRLSAAINGWFDDRMRPRALLIGVKNQLDYWMFGHSDKIFVGKEGWLYQPAFFDVLVAGAREGQPALLRAEQTFVELADYLQRRNIRLVVIAHPTKHALYPQFMPKSVPQLPADDPFQKIRRFLASRQDWIFIDGQTVIGHCIDSALFDKPIPAWFNKIDIHPQFPAGPCFARELVTRIAEAEHVPSPWHRKFVIDSVRSRAGGQADFMAVFLPPSQETLFAVNAFGFGSKIEAGKLKRHPPGDLIEWSYHSAPGQGAQLPGVTMFGDSFLDHYMSAGVFTYFSDMYRIRDSGTNMPTLLRAIPEGTKYFVFEFIEPYAYTAIREFDLMKRQKH